MSIYCQATSKHLHTLDFKFGVSKEDNKGYIYHQLADVPEALVFRSRYRGVILSNMIIYQRADESHLAWDHPDVQAIKPRDQRLVCGFYEFAHNDQGHGIIIVRTLYKEMIVLQLNLNTLKKSLDFPPASAFPPSMPEEVYTEALELFTELMKHAPAYCDWDKWLANGYMIHSHEIALV